MPNNKNKKLNYAKAVVIVHGKSERLMTEYIKSHLKINIRISAKDKGQHSIQITSLKQWLDSKIFKNADDFEREFGVDFKEVSKDDFKVFIIMDTDDCTVKQKENFITGNMFNAHWLHDYIVPIYNSPNLDKVLAKAGVVSTEITDIKGERYAEIFPINHNDIDNPYLEIELFNEKIKEVKDSNLSLFVEYCLKCAETK